jgi:hypothetical protein
LLGFRQVSLVSHETACERRCDGHLAIVVSWFVRFGSGLGTGLHVVKCCDSSQHLTMADWILLKQAQFLKSCVDDSHLSFLITALLADVLGFT